LEEFYPNNLLITGFDILFFWVARMLMMGRELVGELPFPHIYLHALVKDEKGEKMSKSKGNVIDPLEMVDKFSADAMRFTLAILAVQGRDIKLSVDKLEQSRNFTNKLFNASNYLLMNQDKFDDLENIEIKTPLGKYMLEKFNNAVKESRDFIEQYRFNDGATTLYRYLWGEFCDWGIELSKASKESIGELGAIFKESMKLLHPYMPFITEFLYQRLSGSELSKDSSIMVKPYPKVKELDNKESRDFDLAIEAIVSLRRCKTLVDMGNKRLERAYIKFAKDVDFELLKPFIEKLAKVDNVELVESKPANSVVDVSDNLESFISTDDIDLAPIIDKLNKQKAKLEKEINKLSNMLNNKNFVANAPKEVVEQNQKALDDAKEKLSKIESELNSLV
jgi:valyl-tRNA synthetase